jgi:probable rRNA maturation factor
MKLQLINQSDVRMPKSFIEDWLVSVEAELLKKKIKSRELKKELVVVFMDTKPARKLNQQYRKRDYATDVLSFQAVDEGALGDLVLCPQVLKRQAKEHSLSFQAELGYMLLHGVLHLLGYDHEENPKDAKKMFELQDQVFERLMSRR